MYFRAIAASKLGPDDVERLDRHRDALGSRHPWPASKAYLRKRTTVAETVGIYLRRLREQGWKDIDRPSGWVECWYCARDAYKGKSAT